LELATKTLYIEPDNLELLSSKAKSLQILGRHKEAIIAFEQILGKNPENTEVLFQKAKSLLLIGKIPESLAVLQTAVNIDPLYKQIAAKDLAFTKLGTNLAFKSIIS
jgi:tetratricopeptide (TPR) repeat protein